MKSRYLSALLLACASAPAAFAFNLYDTAPSVGMPESYAIRYNSYVTVGYDDNINSRPTDQEGSTFSQFGVGAAYSDQESVTAIAYNVSLGGRLYNDEAESSSRQGFFDCSATASLTHSFSAESAYTTSVNLSFSPDLNIADSISSSYTQGEVFRWAWNHAYSQAIDSRWSWTASAAYNGNVHENNSYRQDDRHFLTGGLTLAYRYSPLTTYNISSTYRHDFRREGENSQNIYFNLGLTHSLTPISSVYATVGVQLKSVAGHDDLYPNLRAGYRREIGEGLSANIYFSMDNENVDSGYSSDSMYLSDVSLRAGANLVYTMTHKVSFHADVSVLNNQYSEHTGGRADKEETTWVLAAGMRYKFTERLTGLIDYQFTSSEQDWGDYHRNKVSTGVTYTF